MPQLRSTGVTNSCVLILIFVFLNQNNIHMQESERFVWGINSHNEWFMFQEILTKYPTWNPDSLPSHLVV